MLTLVGCSSDHATDAGAIDAPAADRADTAPPDAASDVAADLAIDSTSGIDATTSPDAAPDASDSGATDGATRPGWTLAFHDEFEGSSLDMSVWHPYANNYGSGNRELQCETPDNVRVENGHLIIEARREDVSCPGATTPYHFTGGFLGTRENGRYFPRYGRYEMRAQLPHGNALWPAFWLRHRDGAAATEIDIMEYFHAQLPGSTTSTLHYNNVHNVVKGSAAFEAPTRTPGWHVWAAEIEPVGSQVCLSFFVDDRFVNFNGRPAGQPYCFTDVGPFARYSGEGLFDIALNLSVGGDWVGNPDGPLNQLTNGMPAASTGVLPTVFPADYVIDYVRVYTR